MSGFIKNAANFNSFLFGSIVAISNGELYLVIAVSMAVLLMFLLMYKNCFMCLWTNKRQAGRGARKAVNFLFTV